MADKLMIGDRLFEWGRRTYLMGVLNVTPDSFSDGGKFDTPAAALNQARVLEAAGADIIDIGGQSTRPGAVQITLEEECDRLLSVLQIIRPEVSLPISVDTTRAAVAASAVEAGANMVNDISGGTFDEQMLSVVAALNVPIVLMHMRGNPQTMQQLTNYEDLIGEINDFFHRQTETAINSGIDRDQIIIDPGIGFAKNYQQSLEIIRRLSEIGNQSDKYPILIGASRKSFIGKVINQPDPLLRVWGTAGACCAAILHGADILRVHDVKEMHDVAKVADAIAR